jgi:hypothetical protein
MGSKWPQCAIWICEFQPSATYMSHQPDINDKMRQWHYYSFFCFFWFINFLCFFWFILISDQSLVEFIIFLFIFRSFCSFLLVFAHFRFLTDFYLIFRIFIGILSVFLPQTGTILFDWLVDVHLKFKLLPETLCVKNLLWKRVFLIWKWVFLIGKCVISLWKWVFLG